MKTKYIRKGKNIKTIATGEVQGFKTINLAKKESRKLQMNEDGGLGRGALMLE